MLSIIEAAFGMVETERTWLLFFFFFLFWRKCSCIDPLTVWIDVLFFCVLTEKILPVVKNQHLLLCTLLICNAAAMEVQLQAYACLYVVTQISYSKWLFFSDTSYFSWWSCYCLGRYPDFSDINSFVWWGEKVLSLLCLK